jgi:hypothetical protein
MINNGWTQEIDRLQGENEKLRNRELVGAGVFYFLLLPAYAGAVWVIIDWLIG